MNIAEKRYIRSDRAASNFQWCRYLKPFLPAVPVENIFYGFVASMFCLAYGHFQGNMAVKIWRPGPTTAEAICQCGHSRLIDVSEYVK